MEAPDSGPYPSNSTKHSSAAQIPMCVIDTAYRSGIKVTPTQISVHVRYIHITCIVRDILLLVKHNVAV